MSPLEYKPPSSFPSFPNINIFTEHLHKVTVQCLTAAVGVQRLLEANMQSISWTVFNFGISIPYFYDDFHLWLSAYMPLPLYIPHKVVQAQGLY